MGWCSATEIFDDIAGYVFDEDREVDAEGLLERLIVVLENNDWDCQQDSEFYEYPFVQKIYKKLHPEWFEDEDV